MIMKNIEMNKMILNIVYKGFIGRGIHNHIASIQVSPSYSYFLILPLWSPSGHLLSTYPIIWYLCKMGFLLLFITFVNFVEGIHRI